MKLWHLLIALQTVAAPIGLFGLASFYGAHLLDPSVPREATIALRASFALVIAVTIAVVGALLRKGGEADVIAVLGVAAMLATALAGYVPRLVDEHVRQEAAVERIAGDRRDEEAYLAEFARRKQETELNLRDHKPLTPDDALELLIFLRLGDFRNVGLADHTPAALALLREVLEAKIIDPNGSVAGDQFFGAAASTAEVDAVAERLAVLERQPQPSIYELNTLKAQLHQMSHNHRRFEELRGKPLFLFYYEAMDLGGSIKYHFERGMAREWEIMELLVQYGADLSRSDAASVVADLATWKSRMAQKSGDAS